MNKVYIFFIATTLYLGLALPTHGANPASNGAAKQEFVPGELLIQFRPGASEADKAKARARIVAIKEKHVKKGDGLRKGDLEHDSIPRVYLPSVR